MFTKNGNILKINGNWLNPSDSPVPPGPGPSPSLPPYTIRLRYMDGEHHSFDKGTAVQVSSSPNIWDLTYENNDWTEVLYGHYNLLEVIAANTTGVTEMINLFSYCRALTTVPLFDTSSVIHLTSMFYNCSSLTYIPLFNTSSAVGMNYMFRNCTNVEGGALALYQQASSQTNPPEYHTATFKDCGTNTVTGAAELEQIPAGWKS